MKNILITGSTSGIGQLAALELAKKGHRIYIHGRNPEKVDATLLEIKSISKNENVFGFVADLSDLSAVKKLGKEINTSIDQLDVLINNAGIFKSPVDETADGFDIRFAVNYFAPFLLTNALLPILKKAVEPRIINLSSASQAPVSLQALSGKTKIYVNDAYSQSKLALTMWSFYLARKEENISVIAANPGSLLNTKMVIEAFGEHWAPAEKGGAILSDLATSDEYKNVTGKYFDNDKGEVKGYFSEAHVDAYDERKINELVEFTASLLD